MNPQPAARTFGVLKLFGVALAAFGFAFSLVPLYRIACEKVFGVRLEQGPATVAAGTVASALRTTPLNVLWPAAGGFVTSGFSAAPVPAMLLPSLPLMCCEPLASPEEGPAEPPPQAASSRLKAAAAASRVRRAVREARMGKQASRAGDASMSESFSTRSRRKSISAGFREGGDRFRTVRHTAGVAGSARRFIPHPSELDGHSINESNSQ